MRKSSTTTLALLLFCVIAPAQKKKFFDHIDVMLNLHAGESDMEKDGWTRMINKANPAYVIDTFFPGMLIDRRNRHRIDMFSSASVGVRLAKTVVRGNQKNKTPERLEWRLALLAGTTSKTISHYSNYDYTQPLPSGEFTYRQLDLTYRRNCVDLNSHLVYKFRDPFFREQNIFLFFGMGAGVTANVNGRTRENLFTYRATPTTFGHTITEENNISRLEKVETRIDPYFTMLCGGEIRCSDRFSILFEITTTAHNQTYSSGGYLSTIFRFNLF